LENVTNCAGTTFARYWYDYTGRKIKAVENGITTYYPFPGFESFVNGTRLDNTTYYYANGEIVARKDSNGAMHYYHGDQLGSTSLITDASGNVEETTKYYPFGALRSGGAKTKYLFNGKELASATGLYYYLNRWYYVNNSHWTQPDPSIPDLYNPQSFNRYSYVENNPVKYTDEDGKSPLLVTAAIGVGVGAAFGAGAQVYYQWQTTGTVSNWNAIGESAVVGGVSGGVAGLTLGFGAPLIGAGGLGLSGGAAVVAEGSLAGVSSVTGGQAARATSNYIEGNAITSGIGNPNDMAVDFGTGIATWGILRKIPNGEYTHYGYAKDAKSLQQGMKSPSWATPDKFMCSSGSQADLVYNLESGVKGRSYPDSSYTVKPRIWDSVGKRTPVAGGTGTEVKFSHGTSSGTVYGPYNLGYSSA
jgi:RHS repeat-associated protein